MADDWEEAAAEEGWRYNSAQDGWFKAGESRGLDTLGMTAQDLCKAENIDPYQREVFEH